MFKDARWYLKLWKKYKKIQDGKVALFHREVPDSILDWSNENLEVKEKYIDEDISEARKRNILTPIMHSTLLRSDVSSERLLSEHQNVQFHFNSEWMRLQSSMSKNDEILGNVFSKLKAIMAKSEDQQNKLICLENTYRHLHAEIEDKSAKLESDQVAAEQQISEEKERTQQPALPKAPWRDFGVVYDTEEKQFMHKNKVVKVNL